MYSHVYGGVRVYNTTSNLFEYQYQFLSLSPIRVFFESQMFWAYAMHPKLYITILIYKANLSMM